MAIRRLILIVLMLVAFKGYTQPIQRLPVNGGNGYNGSTPRSFLIQWDSLAEATHYEYVMSDNSLCFAGCSGDTRNDQVAGTYAVESNMVLNKWYYWIVRAFMENGDTTYFSPIHSFYTFPRPEDARTYFTLSPNRVEEEHTNILVAWTIDPQINSFEYHVFNMFGETVKASPTLLVKKNELEQTETFSVDLEGLRTGLYVMQISTSDATLPERFKFLLVK